MQGGVHSIGMEHLQSHGHREVLAGVHRTGQDRTGFGEETLTKKSAGGSADRSDSQPSTKPTGISYGNRRQKRTEIPAQNPQENPTTDPTEDPTENLTKNS